MEQNRKQISNFPMRHFLFEDKEYRINPRFKRSRNGQDSARALAGLLRRFTPSKKGGGAPFGNRAASRHADARQKCVVKMQYSSSIEAHRTQLEAYLIREGTDREGGRAQLYGTDIDEYRENMTGLNFRVFLSPQSGSVNLKDMTEKFVKKLEYATGYKLYWQAADHYNTSHPHSHLLINGKDQNGKKVDIPRDIVKTFMREYARDICTGQIGIRTREEIALEKEKELESRRRIRLDDRIKDLCGGGFRVDLSGRVPDRERILIRLDNLRKMNLCAYTDGAYILSPRWEEDLRANGRYNAFLNSRSMLQYTNPAKLKLYSGDSGMITGKVTKVFSTDGDASDNHAAIIESLDGKAFFIPLLKKPVIYDGKNKMLLRENDLITVKPVENQQGRLTPCFFRCDVSRALNEIRKNGLLGPLAETIVKEQITKRL